MYMLYKLNRTGETVVLGADRAPGFEFVVFEVLDAPVHMPSGSVLRNPVFDDEAVMPNVVVRGW